jgi:hypothetical protein
VYYVERRATTGSFEERVSERQKVLLFSVLNHQQRGFAGSKLYGGYRTHGVPVVDDFASHEIADIRRTGFQPGSLRSGNLQLTAQEHLRVIDRIDALQLQNQTSLVRPKLLQFDFASLIVLPEREQAHAWGEAVGMTGVQFDRDFAAAALRF